MGAIIGIIVSFFLVVGFGLSTNIYEDFLNVSKRTNDIISFLMGLVLLSFLLYLYFSVS